MFGRRYFGGRYYAPRWFGGGDSSGGGGGPTGNVLKWITYYFKSRRR